MIDSRDFSTTEELAEAMLNEHMSQIKEIIQSKHKTIRANLKNITDIYDQTNNDFSSLKKHKIYCTADMIEQCAKQICISTSIIKATCRLIPEEYDNEC